MVELTEERQQHGTGNVADRKLQQQATDVKGDNFNKDFTFNNHQEEEQQQQQQQQEEIDLELVKSLRELLKDEYEEKGNDEKEPYARSMFYAEIMDPSSPITCWRFLKESNKSLELALDLAKRAIVWRLDSGADDDDVEATFAKEFYLYAPTNFCGKTREGQDIFFIVGRDYQKSDAKFKKHVIRFVQNLIVTWDKQNRYNMNQMTCVFDVTDTGYKNLDLDFMSWIVGIVDYFPCRFHHIYVVGIPYILRPVIRLIISWLPEKFSKRVYCGGFEDLIEANIDYDNLPDRVGGTRDNTMRLAPLKTPWLKEVEEFNDPKMIKAIEYCLCCNISEERKKVLKEMQMNHEKSNQS